MEFRPRLRHALIPLALLIASPAVAAMKGDTDGDGKLSPAEFQAMTRKQILRADTNGDGKVSLDEWKARPASAKMKDPEKMFKRLDINGDGFIDGNEIDALAKKRFERLDTNGDGFLTQDELDARKAAKNAND
jgi:Ca2+-binding EF-hand superfamily protein